MTLVPGHPYVDHTSTTRHRKRGRGSSSSTQASSLYGGSKGEVTKAKTTSAMSRQPSKHSICSEADEQQIHQTQDIRTLTAHPQQGTENVDKEVPAAHKHLRFGGSEGVVTKTKTTSAMSRKPSKHSTCIEV